MGAFRKLFFVLGVVLIVLPILPLFSSLSLIPQSPSLGIISNDILSFVVGVIILILAFLSWRRERKRMMMLGGRFVGPRGPGDAQLMPGMARALEERRQMEQEALRRNYAMQMKAVDKRLGVA